MPRTFTPLSRTRGHCPFLEETEKFNKSVHEFLEGLD